MFKNACTDVSTLACRFQRSNIYSRISKNLPDIQKDADRNLRLVFGLVGPVGFEPTTNRL